MFGGNVLACVALYEEGDAMNGEPKKQKPEILPPLALSAFGDI
jgi:hypothetical protein